MRTSSYRKPIKEINQMAIPLIMQMISSALLGIVDQAMVGRISMTAFGAVGLISSTLYGIIGVLGTLSLAFNIRGSKCLGEEDTEGFKNNFNTALMVSGIIGIVFFVVMHLFRNPIMTTVFGIQDELLSEAAKYLDIYSLTLGLTLMLFIFSALFKVKKMTKWIFYGSLMANIIDVILNYVMIFGKFGFPKMGVMGAATSTVIALVVEICFYILILRRYHVFKFRKIHFLANAKAMILAAVPLAGLDLFESVIIVIGFNAVLARIGVLELSTYSLITNITNMTLIPMFAYASTCLTLVSESNGKKDISRLKLIPKVSLGITFSIGTIIFIACYVLRSDIPKIITSDLTLIASAAQILPFVIFIQFFNNAFTIYKSSLQGIEKGNWIFAMSCGVNGVCLGVIVFLVFVLKIGLLGFYIGLGLSYLLIFVMSYWKYHREIGEEQV